MFARGGRDFFRSPPCGKGLMAETVTLYSQPGCPRCKRARDFLEARGVSYRDVDVTADRAAFDEMRRVSGGARTVPVLLVGENILIGFEEAALKKALKGAGISP